MKPIRIISLTFDLLGEIDNYESMFFTRSWAGIGQLNLRINRHKQHTDKLQRGNIILIGDQLHKVYIIRHREIELDEDGKTSENWKIRALELKSVIGQRLAIPPVGSSYDRITSDAESVMKHYVTNNVVAPADPLRIISQVAIATNQNRGQRLTWEARYKNLADVLEKISKESGLGWNVGLDITNKKWLFDVVEGRTLTANQSILPPVIFSPEFESLKEISYTESDLNYRNSGYVAGQGEGAERRVLEVGAGEGLSRHEVFIDARDVAETTDDGTPIPEETIINNLQERGNRKLSELTQEIYLEGKILTHGPFIYEKDWDLGDIVTIQNKGWGVTMDDRITEVKEIYEPKGFRLEATFGNSQPTLIDKLKQELSNVQPEVHR